MRRAAPALAVLLLLCPRAARAQDCARLDEGALGKKCGPMTDPDRCNTFIVRAMKDCTAQAAAASAQLADVNKKPPPLSEEDEALKEALPKQIRKFMDIQESIVSIASVPNDAVTDDGSPSLLYTSVDLGVISKAYQTENMMVSAGFKKAMNSAPPASTDGGSEGVSKGPALSSGFKLMNGGMNAFAFKPLIVKSAQNAEKHLPPDPQEAVKAKGDAADMYLAAGEVKDAERLGRDMVKTAPDKAAGHSILAQTQLAQGRPAEAADAARRALALDPRDRAATETLGYARALLSKDSLKRPTLRPGFDQSPDAEGPGGGAAGARTAGAGGAGGTGAGAPPPGTAPYSDPRRALSADMRRGLEKERIGDRMGALEAFSRHLDQEPGDVDARLARSAVLLKLGKPEAALADARAAVARAPNDPRALRAEAAALLDLGRFAEALASIDKALALDDASGAGHFLRAQILEKLGRIDEAVAQYRRAAELDPAIAVMSEEALKRLAPGAAGAAEAARPLLRGGLIAASLLLVLLGLMGGARMVTQRRAGAAVPEARGTERTFTLGDLVGGQYRITRELGRGGMGQVFEAVDETLKRPVALKQMLAEFRVSAEDGARFLQEARLVAQLKHPNIAEIHAAVDDGGLFLVFELIDGVPLDKVLASGGAVPAPEARRIVGDMCAALACAHARRIIHRDLKPANVMRTASGASKIMDFGIAHQSRGSAASTQTAACGTPPYMAPEQVMGTVLPSSDLYALGVMSYELLSGHRPFRGPDFLGPKMRGEFAPISGLKPGLPAALDAFFASALAADPSRRPVDAETFRRRFEACWDEALARTVAG